ncbi:MAG: arylesterase [Marinosulfonomonas sp.]|nr:arylesterase [Marinosulfonomonas sp.]
MNFLKMQFHTGYGVIARTRNLSLAFIVILATIGLGARADAEPVTIAALGDSLVHGYGLPPEHGFVPQLQSWLDAHEIDAIVTNAGVSGDTTAGGLSRVDWTLTPEVDAMIVALGGNDALRGLDPDVSRENLRSILQVAKQKNIPVLLVGIAAPANYGAGYKTDFDAIYPALASEFSTLLYPSFLATLLSRPDQAATLRNLMQSDAIHPNSDGVTLIVEDIAPIVAQLFDRATSPQ